MTLRLCVKTQNLPKINIHYSYIEINGGTKRGQMPYQNLLNGIRNGDYKSLYLMV